MRSGQSGSGPRSQCLVVEHVVVVDVHEHGHRLPDDERHPHGRIAIVAPEEAAHYPGQRDLGTWWGHSQLTTRLGVSVWRKGGQERGALTCAIMPVKAQRRNMRRGMLTRY